MRKIKLNPGKLQLNKETIANLNNNQSAYVIGGAPVGVGAGTVVGPAPGTAACPVLSAGCPTFLVDCLSGPNNQGSCCFCTLPCASHNAPVCAAEPAEPQPAQF